MAPIKTSFKEYEELVIEDFERKYTNDRFFSKEQLDRDSRKINICLGDDNEFTLIFSIALSTNGSLKCMLDRQTDERFWYPICVAGRIHFIEVNRYSTFKVTKLCYKVKYRDECQCGIPEATLPVGCKFGGTLKAYSDQMEVGNEIPERATFRLELEFLPQDYESSDSDPLYDGNFYLKRDIAAMRKKIETADVKIICNGKDFWAHKFILSARSEVFAAMFSHKGMDEEKSGEVNIEDCGHEAMDMFLSHLYEDVTPSPDTTFEVAKQLMNLANMYSVQSLVGRCGKIILAHLNEENAIEVAVLGDLYNMDALKKAAKAAIVASDKTLMNMIKDFRIQDRNE